MKRFSFHSPDLLSDTFILQACQICFVISPIQSLKKVFLLSASWPLAVPLLQALSVARRAEEWTWKDKWDKQKPNIVGFPWAGKKNNISPPRQVITATAATSTASAWRRWWTSTCPSSAPSAACGRSPRRTRRFTTRSTSWTSRGGRQHFSPRPKLWQVRSNTRAQLQTFPHFQVAKLMFSHKYTVLSWILKPAEINQMMRLILRINEINPQI